MKIVKESYSIDTSEPDFIHVDHVELSVTVFSQRGWARCF